MMAFVASIAMLALDAVLFVAISQTGKLDPGIATLCGAVIGLGIVAWQTNRGFANLTRSQRAQAVLDREAREHQQELDAQSRDRQNAVRKQVLVGVLWAEIASLHSQVVPAAGNSLAMKAMAEDMRRRGIANTANKIAFPAFTAPYTSQTSRT
jgi:gamma-glutamyl-gamma-aminobutyrate hydrolase PuuD